LGEEADKKSLLRTESGGVLMPHGEEAYLRELGRLQVELNKLQAWVVHKGLKIVVVFEGRDTAGKGGVIRVIADRLNPRVCRIAALPAPTEREKTQWYFQRYIAHLPAAGEIVLYDRSWYNRAGVERVMGFCNDEEYEMFLRDAPVFEKMLVDSGVILLKYWLDISQDVQDARLTRRLKDPTKRWKLSPMDLASRSRWAEYTSARDRMFEATHKPDHGAAWNVVEARSKRLCRLNLIQDLLSSVEYGPVPHDLPQELEHVDRVCASETDICTAENPDAYEIVDKTFWRPPRSTRHTHADSDED